MNIKIKNAYANNLKNIDVDLPNGRIIGVEGVSGSGKSTLVKDVIAAYGVKDYAVGVPAHQRGFITNNLIPSVEKIDNLPATVMIDVINSVNNLNSTLSTITGIHTLLRKLFEQYGIYQCPVCGKEIHNNIYDVIRGIAHRFFVDIKCDAQYGIKVHAVKEIVPVENTEYYDSNDILQSKKSSDGYARLFLMLDDQKAKSVEAFLRRDAALSLRVLITKTNEFADFRTHTICENCYKVLPKKSMGLFSFNIMPKDGGGACSLCSGSGHVMQCNADILDKKKPMNAGGIPIINDKGVQYTTVTEKFLDAVAKKYSFTWNELFEELNKEQQNIVLHGSDEKISFTDRRGANGGKKSEKFLGIENYVVQSYKAGKGTKILSKYVKDDICPSCRGNRLDRITNQVKYQGKTLNDILSMNLVEFHDLVLNWIKFSGEEGKSILDQLEAISKACVDIGCGYLELNRQSMTLSGGELQRLRLCRFLSGNVDRACILLDEPTTGLHPKDIGRILQILYRLKNMGNTIVLIEHNKQMLSACDYIVELGPEGGNKGGYLLKSDFSTNLDRKLKGIVNHYQKVIPTNLISKKMINISDFSSLHIHHQNVKIPLNALTVICGVSGSGKSTFINNCLIPYVSDHLKELNLKRIENLGQKNAARTSTSTVGSLLNINDTVAKLYADTSGLEKSNFMLNSTEGKCPVCEGKGVVQIEDGIFEICDNCEGKRFEENILQYKLSGFSIYDFLNSSVEQLIDFVEDPKLKNIFQLCCRIGVGYLSLSRTSKSLSKGELQRIKLVNVIANAEKGNLYVLDEPSKGLHTSDIKKILDILNEIILEGNTVIAVEHNLDFIVNSDYAVEFGPESGKNGGQVVFSGNASDLAKCDTATGVALKVVQSKTDHADYGNRQQAFDEASYVIGNHIIKRFAINYCDISEQVIEAITKQSNNNYIKTAFPSNLFVMGSIEDEYTDNECATIPLIRPVGYGNISYGRKTRIVDAINAYTTISRYFMPIENQRGNIPRILPDVFSPGSSIGKCPVCKGKGEVEQIDFNLLVKDGSIVQPIEAMLKKRTNYMLAKKCLKKEYGLNIFENIDALTEDEANILFFGDKSKRFRNKDKEYYWEGLNRLVISELKYIDDEELIQHILESKKVSSCRACQGKLLNMKYQKLYKTNLTFEILMQDRFKNLICQLPTGQLSDVISLLCKAGLENQSFSTKLSELTDSERAVTQLIAYLLHPIYGSLIVIKKNVLSLSTELLEQIIGDNTDRCTIIVNSEGEKI